MRRHPIIALLSDFGGDDAYAASMKAVILSINPKAAIVDISHSVAPQNIDGGAYVLWSVYRYFPKNTIFVCVVDPDVGNKRNIICARGGGLNFLAPDNGILKFILNDLQRSVIYEVSEDHYFLEYVSHTFHGRDIFAPVSAHLSRGIQVSRLGSRIRPCFGAESFVDARWLRRGHVAGRILHIDHFGNIVTNIKPAGLPTKPMVLHLGGRRISSIFSSYVEAPPNTPFMLVGSASMLEVSVKNADAVHTLGAWIGQQVSLRIS